MKTCACARTRVLHSCVCCNGLALTGWFCAGPAQMPFTPEIKVSCVFAGLSLACSPCVDARPAFTSTTLHRASLWISSRPWTRSFLGYGDLTLSIRSIRLLSQDLVFATLGAFAGNPESSLTRDRIGDVHDSVFAGTSSHLAYLLALHVFAFVLRFMSS